MKRIMIAFTLTLLLTPSLFAQTQPAMKHDCAAMMQQHDAMQKHSAEMDAKLQALVDEMNKAKGSAKVDRMAAVVSELVAQRSMMKAQMADMHPKMMEHMKEHMRDGMMKGMAESMSGCPMMKAGDKTPAPPATEHKH